MIAGLPLESWILIVAAVGVGLVIELAFLRAQRHRRPPPGEPDAAGEGREVQS